MKLLKQLLIIVICLLIGAGIYAKYSDPVIIIKNHDKVIEKIITVASPPKIKYIKKEDILLEKVDSTEIAGLKTSTYNLENSYDFPPDSFFQGCTVTCQTTLKTVNSILKPVSSNIKVNPYAFKKHYIYTDVKYAWWKKVGIFTVGCASGILAYKLSE